MRIGAHLSIGRGFAGAAREAGALGCEAMQVFSRSPRGGKAKPLDDRDVTGLKAVLEEAGIRPLVVHAPYYLNLASEDESNYTYSAQVLAGDVVRAAALGASFVVTHPGHRPSDGPRGLERLAAAVRAAIEAEPGGVRLLIENTAGQGREIGSDLAEIAQILHLIGMPERTGVCVDTCHAFAAGHDLRDAAGVGRFLGDLDGAIGFGRVFLMHLNDSVYDVGSKKDRHQHIGRGKIGLDGFRAILNHPRLQGLAGVIETPVDDEESNRANLETLRRLREWR
ncbi:MAG: deoxyribonuclease IV [Firmicutes bacterium]|nr:deoxyribonuclease IV [Bacillota bacterium]